MIKKVFITNTIILTLISIVAKFIGLFFRGYMCTKVGPEGVGLYSLVCSVYAFLSSIPASGLSFSVIQLVSDYSAKNKPEKAKFLFLSCLFISVFLGIILSFFMFFSSSFIATDVFNDLRAEKPLKILSLGVPFLVFSACFRGYFYAKRQIIKIAFEQIIEQLLEIFIFIIFISNVSKNDVEGACCAIVIGTVIAEAFSCVHSYLMYLFSKFNKALSFKKINFSKKKILKKIFNTSSLVTLSSFFKNGLSTIEDILIPSKLKCFNISSEKSLASYGIINGMALPVILFPRVLIGAFSSLLLPEISSSNAINDQKSINRISEKIIRLTLEFSIFFAGFFWFFAPLISEFVYKSKECAIYIFILAPLVPIAYIGGIAESILRGLFKQTFCLILDIVSSLLKIFLIHILLPKLGPCGLIILMFLSTSIETFFLCFKLIKTIKIKISFKLCCLFPFLCISFSCFCSHHILKVMSFLKMPTKFIFLSFLNLCIYLFFKNIENFRTIVTWKKRPMGWSSKR